MPPEVMQGADRTSPLPTGTITFLFSDIEGSTQRWEAHPDAMKAAVARHERLMRAAIEAHGGYVFKTIGDAFCAAFPTAPQALKAALDCQRAIATDDFTAVGGMRIRIGIHTGHAEERDGDYFGPAVNRVARVMSIGHGGQTLLSSAARSLTGADLPHGTSLIDLGSHRLKDLTEPEQVWQLAGSGLPEDFPPLKSLNELPNNLPIQHTSFRGRERDVQAVEQLLREHHLVTLVGSPGIGKTRLALQAAADVLEDFADGVWLADLAPIADAQLVASVIAKELGVVQSEDYNIDDAVVQWLKRKQLLLLLDNCEHLLEAVVRLTDRILRTCPGVRILSTSRQALGMSGEFVYRLPTLDLPATWPGMVAEDALRYGAIALFVDRAVASDMRFALTDDNLPGVADICRRLDGIPLAIELAAARVKVLSIPNLAQRLNERFKLLTAGSRTALPRQKTLGALIDWSYDLLSSQERRLFERCAIFSGGFSLDAATAVCADEGIDETEVLDLLASLADKSLLVAETTGDRERYRLLESTRAYAFEKLASSDEHQQIAAKHAQYFRARATEIDALLFRRSTFQLVSQLEEDLDNFRSALEWALKQGHDVELGAGMVGALQVLWIDGGLQAEGRWWVSAALECVSDETYPAAAARICCALAGLSAGQRRYDAAERSLRLFEQVGDDRGKVLAMNLLISGCLQTGRGDQGLAVANELQTLALKLGLKAIAAASFSNAAIFLWSTGDTAQASKRFDEALTVSRQLEDETSAARIRGNAAEFEFAQGNTEKALISVLEAISIYARGKNYDFLTTYHNNSAAYRIALGDLEAAYEALGEGLRWARDAQSVFDTAVAIQHLALIGALRGRAQEAARLLGYVNQKYRELGIQREYTEKWGFEKLQELLAQQLSAAEIAQQEQQGVHQTDEEAVELALACAKADQDVASSRKQ